MRNKIEILEIEIEMGKLEIAHGLLHRISIDQPMLLDGI